MPVYKVTLDIEASCSWELYVRARNEQEARQKAERYEFDIWDIVDFLTIDGTWAFLAEEVSPEKLDDIEIDIEDEEVRREDEGPVEGEEEWLPRHDPNDPRQCKLALEPAPMWGGCHEGR